MNIASSFSRHAVLAACVALTCMLVAPAASAVTVAKITLTVPSKTLKIGHKETLKAVARDASGHAIIGVKFTWTSSKATVVRVGTTGIITALKAGSSTIKASGGGKSASVIITVPVPTSMTGVAAKGAAMAGATITLKDKNGATLTTTTDSNGNYSLTTTGLVPPFLVRVQTDTATLYSVSDATTASKVVNVTPLTDLIIRSWYSVQGKTIDTAFAAPSSNPAPSPTEVQIISNVVVQVTALWLQQNGVDTSGFSPISTPFVADSTGVDAVLDATTIDTDTGLITITTGGSINQSSNVSYDTGTGSINVDTTITDSDTSTTDSSVQGTVVATDTTEQTALTAITTSLTNFAKTVNAKGAALKGSDLLPFLDTNLLSEGLNKTLFADSTADQFNGIETGGTPVSIAFQVLGIPVLDTAQGLATVDFTFTESAGDQSQTQTVEFFFKKQSNGSWLFFGDQLPAHLSVQSEMRTNQGANADTNGPDVNADVRPLHDLYSGISIDDGGLGIFTNQGFTAQGTEDDTVTPDPAQPGTTVAVTRDVFFTKSAVLTDLVPAGTPMTITMTPVSGTPKDYVVKTNATTTEAISITNLTGSTMADATLGTALPVQWTLPVTFAIAEVRLEGFVDTDPGQGDDQQCKADSPVLSITATSGDITFPTTCGGLTPLGASINLEVIGVNGERELVIYMFQDP